MKRIPLIELEKYKKEIIKYKEEAEQIKRIPTKKEEIKRQEEYIQVFSEALDLIKKRIEQPMFIK